MLRYIQPADIFRPYKFTNKKAQAVGLPVLFFKESKTVLYSVFHLSFASNSASITSSPPFLLTSPSGGGGGGC